MLVTVDALVRLELRGKGKLGIKRQAAADVILERLAKGLWPIYPRTKRKKDLIPDRRLLFYAGGRKELSGHVLASAKILSLNPANDPRLVIDENYLISRPELLIMLTDIKEFKPPVNLKQKRKQLSFLRLRGAHWGTSLQGGCAALNEQDWATLQPLGEQWQSEAIQS